MGFPISRVVAITCLSSGAILNAAMGPFKGKGSSEHALLRSLLDTFKAGDILLGDALYGSYFLLAECQRRGVDILLEQHGMRRRKTDFRAGKKLGSKDHIIRLDKPKQRPEWMSEESYQDTPDALELREFAAGKKVLISTLCDPSEASVSDLKALFYSRWHVEVDLRNIKTTLGMAELKCKTPQMAEKEMGVYLLAYNLIRLVMAQSAALADVLPRELSFKHAVQLWSSCRQRQVSFGCTDTMIGLIILLAEQKVGNRPGRIEPRAVKRRPKPTPLLMKPRHLAREEIRKNGHPRKVK